MQRKILIPALIMAAGVATAGGLVYAKQSGGVAHNEAMVNLAQAKISLAQAVMTAEQHVGGRASRAELENENGRPVYGVEVADNTKTTDVKVDAIDGSIVSAQTDQADHESDGRHEERDDN